MNDFLGQVILFGFVLIVVTKPMGPWYNLTLGLAMLTGRYLVMIPVLAIAGGMAAKKRMIFTSGSLPTTGPLFVALLIGTIVIVGELTFFPALSLGPVVEHLIARSPL